MCRFRDTPRYMPILSSRGQGRPVLLWPAIRGPRPTSSSAGTNDPCYHLGGIASEAELDDDLVAVLCESYFGETTPRLLARMKLCAAVAHVGWSLYCAIEAEVIPDPGYWEGSMSYWTAALDVFDSASFRISSETRARSPTS